MSIQYTELPFPHVSISNYYTELELHKVWQEIEGITNSDILLPPEKSGAATDNYGTILKNNHCVFMDTLYSDRTKSPILNFNRRLFDSNFIRELVKCNWVFNYLYECNRDNTLLSYYEDGSYYKSHKDVSTLTVLIHLYKEPKMFTGGDLVFQNNYNVPLENNRMIMFPSCINHAVNPIEMIADVPKFSGFGRYTITQFIKLV